VSFKKDAIYTWVLTETRPSDRSHQQFANLAHSTLCTLLSKGRSLWFGSRRRKWEGKEKEEKVERKRRGRGQNEPEPQLVLVTGLVNGAQNFQNW